MNDKSTRAKIVPKPSIETNENSVLTPVESRQGVVSGRVVTILATSLVLAGIAGAVIYVMIL
jgi:hypothetical protein